MNQRSIIAVLVATIVFVGIVYFMMTNKTNQPVVPVSKNKEQLPEANKENLRKLGEERVMELTRYVREIMPKSLREKMKYKDLDNDVQFQVKKVIMVGFKA